MLKRVVGFTFALFVSLSIVTSGFASAVTGSDWQAGKIIDDAIFTNKDSMSIAQIQDFLNSKVGTGAYGTPGVCDTNGTKTSELGDGTRAHYGADHGNPAPFTCLKDYYEVPKTSPGAGIPANNYGGKPIPAGAESAAQLIWDAAQRYNINPQVLLVTIQKESVGPLTTDDWPFLSQYTYAMGAHCPDSGPGGSANCDPNYAGFSIQISESAALFRYYLDNMTQSWWPYKKVGVNSIQYDVSTSCGASNVNITTMATAALYTYTPYQPNQAALDNLYGLGDSCSAYGNRNFWRIFNDWFKSSLLTVNINYYIGDDSVDSNGDVAIIPIRLYNPPLSTIKLNFGVSNPSLVKIVGNSSLTFTTSNWNTAQYITLQGLTADASTQNFNLQVQYINSPDGTYDQSIAHILATLPVLWSRSSEQAIDRLYNPSTGYHAYAVSSAEISSLQSNGYHIESVLGYQCRGSTDTPIVINNPLGLVRSYFSSDIPDKESAIPTILYSNATGSTFVTILKNNSAPDTVLSTDSNEVASLVQNGYSSVTSFLLCKQDDTPIYRLNDTTQGAHFYTASGGELDNSINNGMSFEGVGYLESAADNMPVYRLNDPKKGAHFYTVYAPERDAAVSAGFQYEGIAFYASSGNSRPVYRLFDPVKGVHFYTASQAEVSTLQSIGFKYEGVAFYSF